MTDVTDASELPDLELSRTDEQRELDDLLAGLLTRHSGSEAVRAATIEEAKLQLSEAGGPIKGQGRGKSRDRVFGSDRRDVSRRSPEVGSDQIGQPHRRQPQRLPQTRGAHRRGTTDMGYLSDDRGQPLTVAGQRQHMTSGK